ncbi:MAG: hypothetical protein H7066_05970, partial [Cytophagaceae bacterium]|nr:hypothetical protein [Gemmatimonadaceae bacterium]
MTSMDWKTLIAPSVAMALLNVACASAPMQGPSSSATPYVVPVHAGVTTTSILTVGDSVTKKNKANEHYRMVGIPDGLGAFDNGDGTITVLMNHELAATVGVVRAHGAKGAFVSKWEVRKSDLKVLNGEDLIQTVMLWDAAAGRFVATAGAALQHFCSADLPARSAFFNSKTGLGFSEGRIFMNGEEGAGGRAFAHIVQGRHHGTTFELPSLGRMAWENAVASPYEQDKTVVAGSDDTGPGRIAVYVGMKRDHGIPIEAAGLHGGALYAVSVSGVALENRDTGIASGTPFRLVPSTAPGITLFQRPEDLAWDTVDAKRLYFVTTDRIDTIKDGTGTQMGRSRLWRLNFASIENPEAGGTIDMLLDGSEAGNMFDNITVDGAGHVVLQEDPGNDPHNAKIWKFDP